MKVRNERSFWSSEWKPGSVNLTHHACACIEEEHSFTNDYRRGWTGSVWIRIRRARAEEDNLSLGKTWSDSRKQKKERKQDGSIYHRAFPFLVSHFSFTFLKSRVFHSVEYAQIAQKKFSYKWKMTNEK